MGNEGHAFRGQKPLHNQACVYEGNVMIKESIAKKPGVSLAHSHENVPKLPNNAPD